MNSAQTVWLEEGKKKIFSDGTIFEQTFTEVANVGEWDCEFFFRVFLSYEFFSRKVFHFSVTCEMKVSMVECESEWKSLRLLFAENLIARVCFCLLNAFCILTGRDEWISFSDTCRQKTLEIVLTLLIEIWCNESWVSEKWFNKSLTFNLQYDKSALLKCQLKAKKERKKAKHEIQSRELHLSAFQNKMF